MSWVVWDIDTHPVHVRECGRENKCKIVLQRYIGYQLRELPPQLFHDLRGTRKETKRKGNCFAYIITRCLLRFSSRRQFDAQDPYTCPRLVCGSAVLISFQRGPPWRSSSLLSSLLVLSSRYPLAREDAGKRQNHDRHTGVFRTVEHRPVLR